MPNPRIAHRYAKSLLDLAIEQNRLEETLRDVQTIDSVVSQNPEFSVMLRSPVVKGDKKQAVFTAVFGNNLSALTNGFMRLLLTKGRESNLQEIASAFIAQYRAMKNISSVKLTTATPVTQAVRDRILAKVAGILPGQQIDMQVKVDPELIGGFVLEMGDKLLDASVRKDLTEIKMQFTGDEYVNRLN